MSEELNMILYEKFRAVPPEAQKTITGGRLNGKTDINPMWRIKALTEAFGACGFGWWYEIIDKHLERTDLGEVAAFVDIALYYVVDGQTSKPVYGTGGSAFIAKEKAGLYVSDECYKMALTDAISVACKALGVGADVYWNKDSTKYTRAPKQEEEQTDPKPPKTQEETDVVKKATNDLRAKILKSVRDAGRDEQKAKMYVEGEYEKQYKTFVYFDNMNLGQLAFCQGEINKLLGAK